MTDQPDRANGADAPIETLSFDDALAALQKTVAELEAGGQPLDDAGEAGAMGLPGRDQAQRHARKLRRRWAWARRRVWLKS